MTGQRKRITGRAVAEGEDARLAAKIGTDRVGTIEGIDIDFNHDDLPDGWEPLPWWNVWGPPPSHAGLIFPSEAAAEGLKELRDAMPDVAMVFARPGDSLTVASVETVKDDERSFYDHPHDKEVRLATLTLTRPGEKITVGPLAFYGAGRVIDHGSREAFDHIVQRILDNAEVADFPRPTDPLQSGRTWGLASPEQAALMFAKQAHDAFFRLTDGLPPHGELGGERRAHLRMLANSAALAGFLLAKIEAQPVVERAERRRAAASVGADARRDDGLMQMGRNLEAAHPTWRRNRIAKKVQEHYPHKELSAINRTLRTAGVHGATPH